VALLGPAATDHLATGLRQLGHQVSVIGPSRGSNAPLEAMLRRRGFTTPLSHAPLTLHALLRGRYDVAHAFSPQDAYVALQWRRVHGRPVVFSLAEPIERERLADGRLRLRLLSTALDQSDAVMVPDEEARVAAWRWLALELPVVHPHDAGANERLYRHLLAQT
jgi:hypothetical protein